MMSKSGMSVPARSSTIATGATQWRPGKYRHYGAHSHTLGSHSRGSGKKAGAVDTASPSVSTTNTG